MPKIISKNRLSKLFLVTLLALSAAINAYSQNDTWIHRNPTPTANHLNAVTTFNSKFYAVGYAGTILKSLDSINWTSVESNSKEHLWSITASDNMLIAVGSNGTLLTSSNGEIWTKPTSPTNKKLSDIIWNGTRFIAVGDNVVVTSTDGVNWNAQDPSLSLNVNLNAIAWSGNEFVAVGYIASGQETTIILRSIDGSSWSATGSTISGRYYDITWTGTRFITVGSASSRSIIYSSDGITWTHGITDPTGNTALRSILYDGARLFAFANNEAYITSSDMGSSWTLSTTGSIESSRGSAWNGTAYVSVGSAGNIMHSWDGDNWNSASIDITSGKDFSDVVASDSLFIAVGSNGLIARSENGDNWEIIDLSISQGLSSANWINNLYFITGSSGLLIKSSDGALWETVPLPTTSPIQHITWDGTNYILATSDGQILTSQDTITWTSEDSGMSRILDMATSPSITVAVSSKWSIYSTEDNGATWVLRKNITDFGSYIDNIIWDGNHFRVWGMDALGNGKYYISDDGINWSTQSMYIHPSNPWEYYGAAWSGYQYIAVSRYGHIASSPDGNTWKYMSSNTSSQTLRSIAWKNPTFVAVGNDGRIMTYRELEIVRSSKDKSIAKTSTETITINANGPNITYQWYKDGSLLPNETQASLTLNNASYLHEGQYYAIASNAKGSVQSKNISISISDAGFSDWKIHYFGSSLDSGNSATNSDPDNDSYSNLIEYALGTDPTKATPPILSANKNNEWLTLKYQKIREDLSYHIQQSSDLNTWVELPHEINDGVYSQGSVSTGTEPIFLRLKITSP